jgi:hypothetical protein
MISNTSIHIPICVNTIGALFLGRSVIIIIVIITITPPTFICRVTFLFADLTKDPLFPWRSNMPRLLSATSFRTMRLLLMLSWTY